MPFRICKNPITHWLRESFHATPLLVPEEAYQPLLLVIKKGNHYRIFGHLSQLYQQPVHLTVPLHSRAMSDVSLDKSKAIDIKLGLEILNGFFKALKMENIGLNNLFQKTRTISLSFSEVQHNHIDLIQLGDAISLLKVNTANPVLSLLNDKKAELLLITDTITSKGFTINDESDGGNEFDLNIPLIEKYIADGNLDVVVKGNKKNAMSFEGKVPLCFAFSVAEIAIDFDSQTLRFIELARPKGQESDEQDEHQLRFKKLLDDDEYEPLMLEVDQPAEDVV